MNADNSVDLGNGWRLYEPGPHRYRIEQSDGWASLELNEPAANAIRALVARADAAEAKVAHWQLAYRQMSDAAGDFARLQAQAEAKVAALTAALADAKDRTEQETRNAETLWRLLQGTNEEIASWAAVCMETDQSLALRMQAQYSYVVATMNTV